MLRAFIALLAVVGAASAAEMPVPGPGGAMGNPTMTRPPLSRTPEVKKSSASAPSGSYFGAEKMRNPFLKATAGGAALKSDVPEEFSIHNLTLRGMLKDSFVDYAVFTDEIGGTFLFRKGKLYDNKRNEVQGVSGNMDIKQKTVNLITQDKDVQVYRLGQKDEEDEEAKN